MFFILSTSFLFPGAHFSLAPCPAGRIAYDAGMIETHVHEIPPVIIFLRENMQKKYIPCPP